LGRSLRTRSLIEVVSGCSLALISKDVTSHFTRKAPSIFILPLHHWHVDFHRGNGRWCAAVRFHQRELHRKALSDPLAPLIETMFAGPVLLAVGSHRLPALFLLPDQAEPELAPFFLSSRHAASRRPIAARQVVFTGCLPIRAIQIADVLPWCCPEARI
jgi:hypothetical protein